MHIQSTWNHFLPLICLLISSMSFAEEQPVRYDQINLSAQASMEVDNDTLIAVLYAQKEGSDLSALTNLVNQEIASALDKAKATEGIKVQTLGYRTSPIYQQKRLTGWRVKQSIRLESRQSERLSQLLSRLQSSLALESISYAVSNEQRLSVEEALVKQAISAFQQRAKLVSTQLGHKTFRLIEMSINTSGQPIQPMRMRASMMAMEGKVSAPSLEAGSQRLQVNINGRIELQIQ
ncbi:MAG: SIMPL domain-containing protein [Candidatus Thiodiazotropha sp. (ex Myrtea spinifera)]|nr:SIMPL domain-containing protein [Candidatus Thiodiazotropha sp. (ex Myrtea spinifera)]MCU7828280.1 SIMPL domain-containing protein [Candidatus Thiodiazotropha sp. (ex Myrtea sp. 'scaly one' KF741663)]